MTRERARDLTFLSWFAVLAAIALAGGCATDPNLSCGDDALEYGGLMVSFEGREPGADYELEIEAEGETLLLDAPAGTPQGDVTSDLGGGRTLRARMIDSDSTWLLVAVREPTLAPDHPDAAYLRSESGTSPVTVVARTGGAEVGRATFTPTYSRDYPFGPSCPYYDHGNATLTLSSE